MEEATSGEETLGSPRARSPRPEERKAPPEVPKKPAISNQIVNKNLLLPSVLFLDVLTVPDQDPRPTHWSLNCSGPLK